MLAQVIENILLGFAISAAPGAVFFETIRRSLSRKDSVFLFQIGNFSGMIAIAIISLAGVSTLLSNPSVAILFYAISGGLLLYLGVQALLSKPTYKASTKEVTLKSKYSSFLSGLVLAIANPLSIIFWISLTGKFYQQSSDGGMILLNTVSVLVGALILFVLLVTMVKYLRKKIKETYLILIARISGVIIIFYGLATLAKLFI